MAFHLGARACHRHAGFHAGYHGHESSGRFTPRLIAIEPECSPQIVFGIEESKARRHHADDLDGPFVQLDDAANDAGIPAEALLPEAMAEHGDERRVRLVVRL